MLGLEATVTVTGDLTNVVPGFLVPWMCFNRQGKLKRKGKKEKRVGSCEVYSLRSENRQQAWFNPALASVSASFPG